MNDAPSREKAVRFEPKDVPALLPVWLAAGLASFVGIVFFVIWVGFPLADHQQYRGPMQALPAAPRLQVAPGEDLARYEKAKRQELSRERIDAAMIATAQQGWGTKK